MQNDNENYTLNRTTMGMNDLEIDNQTFDNSDSISDEDECNVIELKKQFETTYSISIEKRITTEGTYILHMDCVNQKLCLGLSNNICEVYEINDNQISKLNSFEEHVGNIIDVKYSKSSNNIVYTGSTDGKIKIWDLRTPKISVNTLSDPTASSQEQIKPFSCFDTSSNDRLICAGTDLFEGDSFLLFWDVRNTKLLGGYWESHMDDVTKVAFHPTDKDKLASCSTDGLVNIYDLNQTSEDDALIYSLNTESSVEQVLWYKENNKDAILSVTHPSEVQLWEIEEAVPYARFDRNILSKSIKRKSAEHCYIAGMFQNEDLVLLIGSNCNHGECVRGCKIINNKLYPYFTLDDNKQRIRTSYYNNDRDILITGGEGGYITVWKKGFSSSTSTLKLFTKKPKLHNKNPY